MEEKNLKGWSLLQLLRDSYTLTDGFMEFTELCVCFSWNLSK